MNFYFKSLMGWVTSFHSALLSHSWVCQCYFRKRFRSNVYGYENRQVDRERNGWSVCAWVRLSIYTKLYVTYINSLTLSPFILANACSCCNQWGNGCSFCTTESSSSFKKFCQTHSTFLFPLIKGRNTIHTIDTLQGYWLEEESTMMHRLVRGHCQSIFIYNYPLYTKLLSTIGLHPTFSDDLTHSVWFEGVSKL